MRHDTCTDEARCQDYPLCRHRGFPLDEGDTGAAISSKPYREAIGSFVGTVIALSATERERDELRDRLDKAEDRIERITDGWRDTNAECIKALNRAEKAEATLVRVEALANNPEGDCYGAPCIWPGDLLAALHPEDAP